jgi:hypothetical protein
MLASHSYELALYPRNVLRDTKTLPMFASSRAFSKYPFSATVDPGPHGACLLAF